VRFPIQSLAISIIALVRLIASIRKNTQKIPKRQAMKTVDPAVYDYRYHQGTAPNITQLHDFICALFRPWHSVLPLAMTKVLNEGIVTMSRIQLTSALQIGTVRLIISLSYRKLSSPVPMAELSYGLGNFHWQLLDHSHMSPR
jgi:hypothetical protein